MTCETQFGEALSTFSASHDTFAQLEVLPQRIVIRWLSGL